MSTSIDEDVARQRARSMLAMGLGGADDEPPAAPGTAFGDYQLLEVIGRGSTCYVYKASHFGVRPLVALKMMKNAAEASALDIRRFWGGATAAAELDHPNIVPVFHVGERRGRPYFIMKLMDGGTLQDALPRLQRSHRTAARVMAKVARAVQHAHERGVLHRDLKPANILLDAQDEPHVADFGLAKRLDHRSSHGSSTGVAGTLDYMAPEQASGGSCKLTYAADIYALGAIFYELLTGQVPLQGESAYDILQKLINFEPIPPPRSVNPEVAPSFENICLRCLDRAPGRRYRSAGDLADDLESACGGKRIKPPVSRLIRTMRWTLHHPAKSFGGLGASLLVLMTLAGMGMSWRAQTARARAQMSTNAFVATGKALEVLFQLREDAERATVLAADPALPEILARGELSGGSPELRARTDRFDGVALFSPDGHVRAQWPAPAPKVFQRTYTFRDYFQGAMRLADAGVEGAYLARSFSSESHGQLGFAFSVPIRDAHGGLLGLYVALLNAKATLGAIPMEDPAREASLTTVLVGPHGRERDEAPTAPVRSDYTYLVHPALRLGQEYPLPSPHAADFQTAFGPAAPPGNQFAALYVPPLKVTTFRDPLPGYGGPWLAAFAPVGRTGFVVGVQSRGEQPAPWAELASRGPIVVGLAVALFAILAGAFVVVRRRFS